MVHDHHSPKKTGAEKSGFLDGYMCSTSFTQHFSVHKTTRDKDPSTPHPVIHSLSYITNPPSPRPHLYPSRSPPISHPSKESLQYKNAEKHQQSYFAQSTNWWCPQSHFLCFITRKETQFYSYLKNAPSYLTESKKLILTWIKQRLSYTLSFLQWDSFIQQIFTEYLSYTRHHTMCGKLVISNVQYSCKKDVTLIL